MQNCLHIPRYFADTDRAKRQKGGDCNEDFLSNTLTDLFSFERARPYSLPNELDRLPVMYFIFR